MLATGLLSERDMYCDDVPGTHIRVCTYSVPYCTVVYVTDYGVIIFTYFYIRTLSTATIFFVVVLKKNEARFSFVSRQSHDRKIHTK